MYLMFVCLKDRRGAGAQAGDCKRDGCKFDFHSGERNIYFLYRRSGNERKFVVEFCHSTRKYKNIYVK